jgi:outer membrane lipoprotein-sorting protein
MIMVRIASLVLSLALAFPVAADTLSLAQISAYLNSLTTAEARFTQLNGDGSVSTGRLLLKRPGRVRFEYDPPDEALVMAIGGQVAIFDPKSNEPPDRYPLSQTPLSVILARTVDLGRADMVTGYSSDGQTTTVVAQDPDNPEYGSIRLDFTGPPVTLRRWVISDGAGSQTAVELGPLKTGGRIGDIQFNIRAEMRRRGFEN